MVTAPSTTFATRPVATAESCRVAGFLGSGMLDWPGKVAATAFVAGCPLRCPYCHNPELVGGSRRADAEAGLIAHVRTRRDWLDGVVITGGEPTADPGLRSLIERLRAEGMAIKLDTNGTNPELLGQLLVDRAIDFVALDVKAAPERYDRVTGVTGTWGRVEQAIDTILASGIDHEFRTTCYPPAVAPEDFVTIASQVRGGQRLVLQQFRPQRTLDAAALSARPYAPDVLRRAAAACATHLPTVVRGA